MKILKAKIKQNLGSAEPDPVGGSHPHNLNNGPHSHSSSSSSSSLSSPFTFQFQIQTSWWFPIPHRHSERYSHIYIYIYRERERERERISTRIERYGGSFNGGCCPRGGEAISGDTKAIAIPSRGGGGSIKSCWKRSRRWTVGRAGQGFSVSDMHADDQRRVSHSLRPQLLLHVHRHPSSPQERLPLLFTAPHHPQLVPQLLARQGSFSTKS